MTLKILIVDDEPLIRMMLSDAFEELGVEVQEAETADAAWAMLNSGAAVDLVFTDQVMPGEKSGVQLIADIKAHFPAIRTALATGYMKGPSGEVSVFRKPYDVRETARTLMMLAARSPFETG